MATKKTHCPAGHPYDHANTYVGPDGLQHCRRCTKQRLRLQQATPAYQAYRRRRDASTPVVVSRREYKEALRLEALIAYSADGTPRCAAAGCGETNIGLLEIDHVLGDGKAHRRELGVAWPAKGPGFFRVLKRLGWPNKKHPLQVLCIEHHKIKSAAESRARSRKAFPESPLKPSKGKDAKAKAPKGKHRRRCKRGHLVAGKNLYVRPDGYGECRTCKRDRELAALCVQTIITEPVARARRIKRLRFLRRRRERKRLAAQPDRAK